MLHRYAALPLALVLLATVTSCKKEEAASPPTPQGPANTGLQLVQSATEGGYTMDLYSYASTLTVGYNKIFLRLRQDDGAPVSNANMSWLPLMTMEMDGGTFQHSCPYSGIAPVPGDPALYEGHVVFSMASSMGSWSLAVTFDSGSGSHVIVLPMNVQSSDSDFRKRYTSAVGTDGVTYLLAMVQPSDPEVGVNDMTVGLFKRESDMDFPIVDGYTIRVDPRMPGMGNHGAPGSEDLVQGADGFYHGRVGLSMTGYWRINLIVEDGAGAVLCGEPVSDTNEASSVQFKVSF